VFASYTLAFALQLRKKHGETSVRVVEKCPDIPLAVVQYTFTHKQYTEQHNFLILVQFISIQSCCSWVFGTVTSNEKWACQSEQRRKLKSCRLKCFFAIRKKNWIKSWEYQDLIAYTKESSADFFFCQILNTDTPIWSCYSFHIVSPLRSSSLLSSPLLTSPVISCALTVLVSLIVYGNDYCTSCLNN
jgi:hypothetical protein